MKKVIAALVVLAAGAGFVAASGNEATPSITVTGQGKVLYTPDMGYIHVGVSSDGATAAEAWKKNEAIVKRIFAALKEMGLEERDFKTTNLNVQPRYLHKKDEAPKLLGYTVSYDLVVTVRKLDQMGKLLDRMVDAGANRHMNVSFGCSNREELLDQARAKAVAEARKRANLYVTGPATRPASATCSASRTPPATTTARCSRLTPWRCAKARPCRSRPASRRSTCP
jgi:uncharacterized protein YggE